MPGGYGWPTSVDVSSGITERDAKQGFVWGNYFKHPVALFQTRLRLPRCETGHGSYNIEKQEATSPCRRGQDTEGYNIDW